MKTVKAIALSTLFAAGAASANDNNTNGVVCDSTNMTNLELVEVRTEVSDQPQLGNIYAEIEVRNRGGVPNATPLTYYIYANDANGQPILPAVETKTNPFPMESGETSVRFFYSNNIGNAGIDTYTFQIVYPCSTNENDNELVGPVPGVIGLGDIIFRDGFENFTPATAGAHVDVKALSVSASEGTYSVKDKKPAAPALKP